MRIVTVPAVEYAAGKIENLERLNNLEDETIEFNTSSWDGSDIFYLQDGNDLHS